MKRALISLICVVLAVSLCACMDFPFGFNAGKTKNEDDTETTPCTEAETTAPETETDAVTEPAPETEPETETSHPMAETEPPHVYDLGLYPDVSHELGIYGKTPEEAGDLYFLAPNVYYEYDYYSLPIGKIFYTEFISIPENEGGDMLVVWLSKGAKTEKATASQGDKVVYLTFDDGPNAKNTERILDILNEYGVKATFFALGSYIERNPAITKRMYEEGHKVGCHSYTHEYDNLYKNEKNFTDEILKWEAAAEKAIGEVPPERLFRFPGGSSRCKNKVLRDTLAGLGYKGYDWNALNNDCFVKSRPKGMTEEEYLKDNFTSTIKYSFKLKAPHIVLMHETYSQTADMLAWAIEYLIDEGCTFSTLDNLDNSWYY